jgi:hypothetical protein
MLPRIFWKSNFETLWTLQYFLFFCLLLSVTIFSEFPKFCFQLPRSKLKSACVFPMTLYNCSASFWLKVGHNYPLLISKKWQHGEHTHKGAGHSSPVHSVPVAVCNRKVTVYMSYMNNLSSSYIGPTKYKMVFLNGNGHLLVSGQWSDASHNPWDVSLWRRHVFPSKISKYIFLKPGYTSCMMAGRPCSGGSGMERLQ